MIKKTSENRIEAKQVEAYLKKKGIKPIPESKLKTEEYKNIGYKIYHYRRTILTDYRGYEL